MKPFLVLAKTQTTPFIKRLIEEVGDSKIQFLDPWSSMTGSISYDRCLVRTSGVYGDDQDLNFLKKFTGEVVNPLESLE